MVELDQWSTREDSEIGIEGRMQYSPVTCTLVLVDATPAELIALHV